MSLYEAHRQFAWPTPEQILDPSGAGPNVFAQLAKDKLGKAIERLQDGVGVKVGVLAASSEDDATESPLAIVCEFQRTVSGRTLQEAHRLAWNFSYAPLLITIEPGLVRAWSCCEEPPSANENPLKAQINEFELKTSKSHGDLSSQAARSLHWVKLVSGQYFKENESRFKRDHCADYLLLENLKGVRQKLLNKGLDQDICHDLVARIIFVQFLFHRKDSKGRPALDATRLNRLYEERVLSARYEELAKILANYDDSYALFQWLNNKFNGDLFPGKAQTEEERQVEWRLEKANVRPEHLSLLADFVSGKIEVGSGQMSLWPQYSFDAIPIEFISSIYETFVGKKKGVVYTPGYLVDFILDGVLPWNDENWDVKVLDPACGSGIFLVKAYQRLIHRWKKANHPQEPKTEVLRGLLERNLFGVDIDPHAVRVASFSLYLAMCDAIDPRHYWDQVKFPQLRNRRLIASDFFADDVPGFRTEDDKATYDLVIGNAPWGNNIAEECAKRWAKKHHWDLSYGNVGPLFLPKAATLVKDSGYVSMFQPAMNLLFNQSGPVQKFRSRLFEEFKVEEVVNLSALRFSLFEKKAISPACIITMRSCVPDAEPLTYICPKPSCTSSDDYRVIIEPHDVNKVYPHEAATNPLVWTVLMWGGRRDFSFVRRLLEYHNLLKLKENNIAITREGIVRGNKKKKEQPIILSRHIINSSKFTRRNLLYFDPSDYDINDDPYTSENDSTNFSAFKSPQLIINNAWKSADKRFAAALSGIDCPEGVICNDSYLSVHVGKDDYGWLESACLSYNSKVAVYYLLLASGRFASYRPSINAKDMLSVPIPDPGNISLGDITGYDDIDATVRKAFGFKESEWTLVEDLFDYTLPDFKERGESPGRAPTSRKRHLEEEDVLALYCRSFLKVLRAGFGDDIHVSTTIFLEKEAFLPVRMVAVHFDSPIGDDIRHEPITSPDLLARLQNLNTKFMDISKAKGGIFYQRVVRVYDSVMIGERTVPTVYLIKPDQVRYWTRSMAFRDADDVVADSLLWRGQTLSGVATDTEPTRA